MAVHLGHGLGLVHAGHDAEVVLVRHDGAADVGGGGDAPIVVRRVVFLDLGINDESGFALVLGGTVLRAVVVRQELSVGSALA